MQERLIKKNTIYNIIRSCVSLLFPLITYPYVTRVLLTDNLGKVNFGASIVSYFSLLASLGISTYAIRECSKVKNDINKLSKLASEIFSLNILTTLFSYIILTLVLLFCKPLFDYRWLILFQSLSICFNTIGADWLNNVAEDFKFITIRTVVFNVLSIALLFLFVKTSEDYTIYALTTVISNAGIGLTNFFYRKKYCKIKIVKDINFALHFKPILLLFSLQLVQIIYTNSDITILGLLRTDHEVGLYSSAVKIYNLIQTFMNSIVFVVLPQLSQSYKESNYNNINRILRYALNFTIALGLPCVVGTFVIGRDLIVLFCGIEYIECLMSLRILMIALFWSLLSGFLGNLIMIPSGKENISLKSSIISALINLILNILLIPKWGIIAAAFTTSISMLVGFIYKLPFVDSNIRIKSLKKIILGPILGCVFIVLIGIFTNMFIKDYWERLAVSIIGSVIIYFGCLLILGNELAEETISALKRIKKGR